MDIDDKNIALIIANQTGLSEERVNRIVKLGEPWPFVEAFGELLKLSSDDAAASNVEMEVALAANAELISMGHEAISADNIHLHLERTAALTGEDIDTVITVQSALYAFFRMMMKQVDEAAKAKEGQKSPDHG
jgi:hypothetical protein